MCRAIPLHGRARPASQPRPFASHLGVVIIDVRLRGLDVALDVRAGIERAGLVGGPRNRLISLH